jgi:PAS domain S-box-containing protein
LLLKIFDILPDAIFLLDAEMPPKIVNCNKVASTIFGYAKDEMIGKTTAFLHVDEESLKKFQSLLYPAMEKNAFFHFPEYKMKRKDGSIFPSEHWVSQLLNNEGKRIGWVSLVRDITKYKQVEVSLRASEKKYRRLIESANEGIWVLDAEAKITMVNTRVAEMFGYTVDEMLGKPIFSFLGEYNVENIQRHLEDRERGIRAQYELECPRKDGTRLFVSIAASPITDDKGNYVGAVAFISDITRRKKAEQALLESEEKLRQYSEKLEELVQKKTEELFESEKRYSILVEEAEDGVVILQDGKIVFSNKKCPENLGYSRDEVIGLPFEKLVGEKFRQLVKERYARRLLGETVTATYEIEVIAKNGERVPFEIRATLINYQGRSADLVVLRDVRERKRMEEQRLRLEKLAAIGEVTTMVAHDLRNPLTSIRNASFYIKSVCPCRADVQCKTALEMVDVLEKETTRAANIINDLLEFASKRPLQKTRQNINELIEDTLVVSNIPKNINVEKNFAEKAIASIDKKQLQRVFLNLIENAVQAMPNGGKLTVTTSETEDHIEMAFTDTGMGIPEEITSGIFQPFFTTRAKGIGIGLTASKKIVEQHGGTIGFKSKLGQGTTFIIKLPKKEEITNGI